MRLTLRTLLAYMDGLLDPKDSQEIGKKIEDSKFASELFHKIRDVMRRLRLAAPSITERAANLDCNTVAEYLDNALPADRVPDFEEVSLKSEMHLAEVASCHQILTMVLGEPAEIDPASRQRMYQLPTVANRVDEERLAAVEAASMLSGDGNAAVPPVLPLKVRPRPVVPEYLRDPPKKSRLLLAAAIMLFVGATVGLVWLTVYPNSWQWVQAKLHGNPTEDEKPDIVKKGLKESGESDAARNAKAASKSSDSAPLAPGSASAVPAVGKGSGNPLATVDKSEVPVPAPEQPLAKPVPAVSTPTLPPGTIGPPESVATTPPAPEPKPGAGEKSPPPAVVGPDLAGPDLKGTEPKPLPDGPVVGSPLVKPSPEVVRVESTLPPKPGIVPPAVGPAGPPPTPENKAKIGRFMSDGQDVLLKLEANNAWRRVLPEEFLAARQPLLALPSYRPRVVVLNVGATLELVNGTRIELLADNAQGQPGVDIDFGRVVIKPLAQAGARLRVVVGPHAGTVTLTSVDSIAGLEVTRVHEPGKDPEKVFSHALTKLYAARGGVVWEEGEGKAVRLTAPAELLLEGASADSPVAGKDVPKWVTSNTVNELEQRAALSVSQALPADRAASLGLMELTEARRKENRWLAVRCLGYLGQFDPMTNALNDVDFSREWPDYIDQLKEAIARGPETAAGIRQSLVKQYGNESAAALYRMLWGYTDKDLEDGEDARLVKFLDHEAPVFRVLAFGNLDYITHHGLYYRPEASAAKRQPSVQQWRKQLQLGRIRFNVPEAKPPSTPAELPLKGTVPEPPKPLHGGASPEVKPASATEPIGTGPIAPGRGNRPAPQPGAAGVPPSGRLPVSAPEPDQADPEYRVPRRPRIAYPEPQPATAP